MTPEEQYKKEKKFLFRFLKEEGLYSAYLKYIHCPKTYNQYQRNNIDWRFDDVAKIVGIGIIIPYLITWYKTKEGYDFWHKVYKEFEHKYREKFGMNMKK